MMTFKESISIFFIILVSQWLTESLHKTEAIISRDLILTPKQELQLRGKSIYYREQTPHLNALASNATQLMTPRSWERTLKHVTYVTLFANAAASNMSNEPPLMSDYEDFLRSPYVFAGRQRYEAPFGDIVTLANGRLELLADNSYRFVEGNGLDCGYVPACDTTRVLALWQVQKVRHRELHSATFNSFGNKRNYRYEIKFNVTPLKRNDNNDNESTEIWHAKKMQKQQTYIQKEEDYPQSFARIIYNNQRDDNAFAERRRVGNAPELKPMAQSTFIHNIFKAPSLPSPPMPPMPLFTSLNTGEYLKDNNYASQHNMHILPPLNIKATPKIELFPNVYNTPNFLKPTTFRPNYQIKLTKTELPALPTHYQANTVVSSGSGGVGGGITHHFHHHFYMPTSTTVGGGGGGVANDHYQRPVVTALETPANSYYRPTLTASTARPIITNEQHAPTLWQLPTNLYGQAASDNNVGQTTKIPLLIYAAPEYNTETSRAVEKPFQQSEPLDEESFRYSEPDPLYIEHSQDSINVQVEAPVVFATHRVYNNNNNNTTELTTKPQIDVELNELKAVATTIQTSLPAAILEQYQVGSQKRNSYVQENNDVVFISKSGKQNFTTEDSATTIIAAATTSIPAATTTTAAPSHSNRVYVPEGPATRAAKDCKLSCNQRFFTRFAVATTTTTTTTAAATTNTTAATTSIPAAITMPATNTVAEASITTTEAPKATATSPRSVNQHRFIPSSRRTTNITTNLRALSRYNNNNALSSLAKLVSQKRNTTTTTTSTEQPSVKWNPQKRRDTSNAQINDTQSSSESNNNEVGDSHIYEATTISSNATTNKLEISDEALPELELNVNQTQPSAQTTTKEEADKVDDEFYEVLTQKSVSKSVSIKVGDNGEEIPIIVDDEENELKLKKSKAKD